MENNRTAGKSQRREPGTQTKGSEHSECTGHKGDRELLAKTDPLLTKASTGRTLKGSKLG